jgi:energy-coupling factor transporter ATP-binding protein EcfA2
MKIDHKPNHYYYIDSSLSVSYLADYFSQANYDIFSVEDKISFRKHTILDAYDALRESFQIEIFNPRPHLSFVYLTKEETIVGVVIFTSTDNFKYNDFDKIVENSKESGGYEYQKATNYTCTTKYYGQFEHIKTAHRLLTEKIGYTKVPLIKWYYASDGGTQIMEYELKSSYKCYDEFYPFLPDNKGVDEFINDYLYSNESILLLIGPPGTGKSSFLRHMISSHALTATLTYDEDILKKDQIFIHHMTNDRSDILVLEDADIILESRKSSNNRMMHKLLNVSDGIIKVDQKKMIFTTNLESTQDIDPALLRPGRCYAVIQFRELTFDEANVAAEVAGMPAFTEKREYTLAEVFNKERYREVKKKQRIGFI